MVTPPLPTPLQRVERSDAGFDVFTPLPPPPPSAYLRRLRLEVDVLARFCYILGRVVKGQFFEAWGQLCAETVQLVTAFSPRERRRGRRATQPINAATQAAPSHAAAAPPGGTATHPDEIDRIQDWMNEEVERILAGAAGPLPAISVPLFTRLPRPASPPL